MNHLLFSKIYIKRNLSLFIVSVLILNWFLLIGCSKEDELTFDQYVTKAHESYADSKPEQAIVAYKKALKLKPDDAQVHFELGEVYYQEYLRTFDLAQNKLLRDLLMNPNKTPPKDNSKALHSYGLKEEYFTLAIEEFNKVLEYQPDNWGARYHIATNYLKNKKYEQAIAEFKKIIKIEPDYSNNYTLIGEAYMMTGQYSLAIKNLKKSIELDPAPYTYYVLGLTYRKNNQGEKTYEILQKLKSMDSSYYDKLRRQ